MDHFNYKDNILFAEDVPVADIVRDHGTPCFIYSRATLERHFIAYQEALSGVPNLICYAVKANSNLAVINVLARLGAGFDIVSGGELERVLMAGGSPDKIIFSGLGKTSLEIERALSVGIHCFNVESEAELERINEIAARLGKQAAISLRVNPDVDAQTHPYISTGLKENKFGIASDRAIEVYRNAASMPNLNIIGIDCHIGSQLTSLAPFRDAMDRLLDMVDQLATMGIELSHLDIGGGLGVNYQNETPPQPKDLAVAISEKLGSRKLKLLMEPGRSIAANAGIFVTRVEYIKCTEHKNFAIVDGAMNDLLRPALYGAWQEIIPVQPSKGDSLVYDVVGPVCESADFLGKERSLCIAQGDLLAVRAAGAYGFAMSSNYNSRNRAVEIMVDGKTVHLARSRETLEDQVRLESCLPT
jgi:diaminopimelate decarboxylase